MTTRKASRTIPKTAAVIPAAGSGRRMGLATPKQFLRLNGVPVLVHTLKVFESSPLIHEICLVVPKDMVQHCLDDLLKPYRLKKVTRVIPGGKTRQDSVYQGLLNLSADTARVAIHDGVRPFLSEELLKRTIESCQGNEGAVAAVPSKDTPKYIREDGTIVSTLDRTRLVLAQTPQVFPRKILMEAYQRAYTDGVYSTDDSALVERLGYKVRIVEGAWDNIKITTVQDLHLAERILEARRSRRPNEASSHPNRDRV